MCAPRYVQRSELCCYNRRPMRYLAGLFDAPAPATAGLSVLAAAGILPTDIRVLSNDGRTDDAHTAPDVVAFLRKHGVPGDLASTLGDAVALGNILLFARAPSARAAAADAALRAVGALDITGGGYPPRDESAPAAGRIQAQ